MQASKKIQVNGRECEVYAEVLDELNPCDMVSGDPLEDVIMQGTCFFGINGTALDGTKVGYSQDYNVFVFPFDEAVRYKADRLDCNIESAYVGEVCCGSEESGKDFAGMKASVFSLLGMTEDELENYGFVVDELCEKLREDEGVRKSARAFF